MNPQDPEYLNRLLKQLNPDVLRAAEATMLKGDIANLEIERDAAVVSTVQSYNGEIAPLRARLAELEQIHAGQQVSLFKTAPSVDASNGPATNAVKMAPIVVGLENPFNAAMNYAIKYPASQKPICPVIPCSNEAIEEEKVRLEEKLWEPIQSLGILNDYHTPKNAQVVTRDGQTFFVFKSAGYKAIAERLGFPYRPVVGGFREYMLTPKEYNDVFVDHERAAKYRKEMKEFKL